MSTTRSTQITISPRFQSIGTMLQNCKNESVAFKVKLSANNDIENITEQYAQSLLAAQINCHSLCAEDRPNKDALKTSLTQYTQIHDQLVKAIKAESKLKFPDLHPFESSLKKVDTALKKAKSFKAMNADELYLLQHYLEIAQITRESFDNLVTAKTMNSEMQIARKNTWKTVETTFSETTKKVKKAISAKVKEPLNHSVLFAQNATPAAGAQPSSTNGNTLR
jgi:hypothetical protein